MNRSPKRLKIRVRVSESMQTRLSSYAVAAGAAGVSALALSLPAGAKIIYTPAHHVIKRGGSYALDVNHDGITDFTVTNTYHSTSSGFYARLSAVPATGNGLEGWTGFSAWAFALKPGVAIGPRHYFPGKVLVEANSLAGSLNYAGSWVNVKNRYAGLRFEIAGKIHYGWARFSVQVLNRSSITATLSGYAYETIPGKPIIAGKIKDPSDENSVDGGSVDLRGPAAGPIGSVPKAATLGLLAMGSPGRSVWRREESAALEGN